MTPIGALGCRHVGVFTVALSYLTMGSDEEKLQAARTICDLAANDNNYRIHVARGGAIPALVALLS